MFDLTCFSAFVKISDTNSSGLSYNVNWWTDNNFFEKVGKASRNFGALVAVVNAFAYAPVSRLVYPRT